MDQGSLFDSAEYVRDGGDHDPGHSCRAGGISEGSEEISVGIVACGSAPACVSMGSGEQDEPVQSEPSPASRVGGRRAGMVRSGGG